MIRTHIAVVVGLAFCGLSAQGRAANELPLSVTDAPASITQSFNSRAVRAVRDAQPDASFAHPELLGAVAVGAYFIYRSRARRVI